MLKLRGTKNIILARIKNRERQEIPPRGAIAPSGGKKICVGEGILPVLPAASPVASLAAAAFVRLRARFADL